MPWHRPDRHSRADAPVPGPSSWTPDTFAPGPWSGSVVEAFLIAVGGGFELEG